MRHDVSWTTGRATAGRPRSSLVRTVPLLLLVILVLAAGVPAAIVAPGPGPAPPRAGSADLSASVGGVPGTSGSPGPAAATPVFTVSVPSGPVGTKVLFSVTGYPHGASFSIGWTPTSSTPKWVLVCSNRTSSTGTDSCNYKIPATAGQNYTFWAKGGTAVNLSVKFQVLPTLLANPTSGPVGTIVILTGTSFGSSSGSTTVRVNASWNGGIVCAAASTPTNLYGNFSCAFSLPAAPAGSHMFTAADTSTTRNTQTVAFTVVPKLVVSPSYASGGMGYGPTGSTIRLTGTGFAATTLTSVVWPIGTACAPTSSANGGFNCTYTIPGEAPGGPYSFQASDGTNHASVPFAVTFLHGSASTATVGTNLTISGGGFTAGAAITIGWVGGTLVSTTTNATGQFPSFLFTVPYLAAGAYSFQAVDGLGLRAGFNLTVVPALSVAPFGGPPGTATTWTGTGFAAGSAVLVSWTAGTACGPVTTNGTGAFSCPYTIPAATEGGPYGFAARDAAGNSASATFTVSFVAVLPPTGPVGTAVNVTGGGFASKVSFNVTLGATNVCTGTTTATGAIACTTPQFKIPADPAGPLSFVASDGTTTATAAFTVVPLLSLKPNAGPVGTRVNVTGSGFAASASVSVGWSGGTACTNTTSAVGGFLCSFVVPSTSVGPYVFTAVDAASNVGHAAFSVVPHLAAQPGSGPVGTTVTLTASGFAPRSPISISSRLAVACTGTTDPLGGFACSYAVPAATKGVVNFTATDLSSDTSFVHFAVSAQLAASPSVGAVGSLLTFLGTGFAAGSPTTVSWTAGTACTNTTSSSGSFACTFVLVPASAGGHLFTAKDSMASPDTASVSFTVASSLELNVSSGSVGTPVTVRGAGFGSNATVAVSGGATTICSGLTGTFGSFSCVGAIPSAVAGNLTVVANDGLGHSAFAAFAVVPSLAIRPTSGPVGTNLSFVGTGFAPSVLGSVGWALGTVCTGTTGANGTFSCFATMPPAAAGAHTFNATDAVGDSATGTFSVISSFNSGLSASPSGGPPGTLVTLQGTGFAAGTTVNVTWAQGLACSNTSDGAGSFSCRFSIPLATPGGAYSFSGSDGRGDTASASFVVTFLAAQPASGPVGTTVTFSGGGFGASSAFGLTWSGGTVCTGTTTASGVLGCTFTVPSVASGPHSFRATDAHGTNALTTFVVLPVLGVSSASGPVGTAVTFTGSAFAPSSAYTLSWSGGVACSGTTSGGGSFGCPFTIPAAAAGLHRFTASDAAGNSTFVGFVVLSSLSSDPTSGPVGTFVNFTGSGFAAGVGVSVNGSGGSCAATADASGGFRCGLAVGARPQGTYTFRASQGGGLPTGTATFTVEANLSVVPIFGPAGTTLSFTGTGFGSSVGISLLWSGGTACTGTTNPAGTFACTFFVPPSLAGGNTTFNAVDSLANSASALYLVVPAVSAAPSFGGPGTTTTFTGIGFKASSAVTVTWAGGTACTATTDLTGQFSCSFTLPLGTLGGAYPFAATDTAGGRASTSFTVTFLSLAPASASVGTLLTFNGGGFAPSSSYGIGWFAGAVCAGTTSATGTFRCTFVLGNATAGPHVFTASDGGGDVATAAVTVLPSLSLSPGSGPSGSHVVLSGTGYAGNLTVTATWSLGGACTATSSSIGSFSCGFTLPAVPTGQYNFTAADASGHRANATFDVVVPTVFPVTISETGLPAGTSWTAVVNGAAQTANSSAIVFNEPNGAYSFTVRANGYRATPAAGSLEVNGSASGASVAFAPTLYAVTFAETGLSGIAWSVTVGSSTLAGTGPSLTFQLPNGTYNFTVGHVAGYTTAPTNGSLVVAGANPATVEIGYSQVTYTLTFNETGLPAGHSWSVTLNGVNTSSTSASITLQRPNGTWTFDIQSSGFLASPWGGSVTVAGANPSTVHAVFSRSGYVVTFVANGLAPGAPWKVTFNGTPYTGTGTSITVVASNGSYSWRVSAVGYKAATTGGASGTVVVNGGPTTVTVTLTPLTYFVVFTEVGLPNGTSWQVSVVGVTTANGTNTSIILTLPNGSYYATYTAKGGYLGSPAGAYVNVSGAKVFGVTFVSVASLLPPTTSEFLGLPGNEGYILLFGGIAGGVVAAAVVGYLLGRRKPQKTLGSDFL